MAGFIYFVPETLGVDARELLPHAFGPPPEQLQRNTTSSGPSGMAGALCRLSPADHGFLGYSPGTQTWVEPMSGVEWRVGYETAAPPGPDELAWPEQVDGHYVRLNDGNDWLIPVARQYPAGSRLPNKYVLGPNGEWCTEVLPQYIALSRRAERTWQMLLVEMGQETPPKDYVPLDEAELMALALEALAINYRVSAAEVSALGLMGSHNRAGVLQALIDWPTVEVLENMVRAEEAKKKGASETPDSSPTGSGEPGG